MVFGIGLDDFAGTGFFSREYLVSTINLNHLKFTTGIGWGKYTGENSFQNPLKFLSNSIINRPSISSNYDEGGNLSSDIWFRGNAALFGGIEWFIPKSHGLKFKIEHDPFDYNDFSASGRLDALYDLRKKDSNINYGLSIPLKRFGNLDLSYIKGNTFNVSISFGSILSKQIVKKRKNLPVVSKTKDTKNEQTFYEDLLFNLNNNNFFLQTASLEDKNLDIAIKTKEHRNAIRSGSYSAYVAKEVSELHKIPINSITVTHLNVGVELNKIKFNKNKLNDNINEIELVKYYSDLNSGSGKEYNNNKFIPYLKFPVIFSNTAPVIVSHIGAPERFYMGGLTLENASEIQFNRNLIITSKLNYMLADNFKPTVAGSNSVLPHVRTDIVSYLMESKEYISRLQLDYIWASKNNLYTRLSGGIFESMYGGFGGEVLYKPFKSNFSIGAEAFYVKKRAFDQKFQFLDYETTTAHINFNYVFYSSKIEANLSYGRYLAKDDGYTLDLSRKTSNGFRSGIYFTRTNISAEEFGEGSFDKGFYFQIPLDVFSSNFNGSYTSFKLSPLTRDGGAKLDYEKGLRGLIYNSTFYDLNEGWDGFLN